MAAALRHARRLQRQPVRQRRLFVESQVMGQDIRHRAGQARHVLSDPRRIGQADQGLAPGPAGEIGAGQRPQHIRPAQTVGLGKCNQRLGQIRRQFAALAQVVMTADRPADGLGQPGKLAVPPVPVVGAAGGIAIGRVLVAGMRGRRQGRGRRRAGDQRGVMGGDLVGDQQHAVAVDGQMMDAQIEQMPFGIEHEKGQRRRRLFGQTQRALAVMAHQRQRLSDGIGLHRQVGKSQHQGRARHLTRPVAGFQKAQRQRRRLGDGAGDRLGQGMAVERALQVEIQPGIQDRIARIARLHVPQPLLRLGQRRRAAQEVGASVHRQPCPMAETATSGRSANLLTSILKGRWLRTLHTTTRRHNLTRKPSQTS